jgi:tetratricopeptide (TPR) repeat protein
MHKRPVLAPLLALCILFSLGPAKHAAAVERLAFSPPLVSSDTAGLAATVSDIIDRAAEVMSRLYAQSFTVVQPESVPRPDFNAAPIASQDKETLTLVISLKRASDGASTPAMVWNGPATADTPLWLARSAFLLWSSFHGFLADQITAPPVYVDELPVSVLNPLFTPLGIAVTSSGTIAAALAMTCVELDRTFRQVGEPGKSLAERSTPVYVGSVAATPGGSFIMKPSMGRDLYRLQPGAADPQRMPAGVELSTIFYWGAFPDGSALLVDAMNRKALRVAPGNKRQDVPIFSSASSWPSAYAIGPEGSIWVYDPPLRGVHVYTSEGKPLDIVLPLVDPANVLAATSMDVGPDGSFLLFANKQLLKFTRDGRQVWSLGSIAGSEQPDMPSSATIAADWARGLIYVCDIMGKRIVKLLDRDYARARGAGIDFEEKVIAVRAAKAGDEAALAGGEAKLYAAAGSTLMAKAWWQKLDDADPGNPDAAAQLLAIELQDIKAAAKALDLKARATLASIGIETARISYVQAIQKYELLLSKDPGDEQSRKAMNSLKDLFSDTGQGGTRQKPLTVSDMRIANLFPSLMQWYASHPPGTVTVSNPLPDAVDKVRISFFIPQFMDLPVESKSVARLSPGDSISFDLAPAFNQKVLELQEDMTTQVQLTVTWSTGGLEQSLVRTGSATIYRNTALTWTDTRKISSFITPNESTVSGFAARVLAGAGNAGSQRLSKTIFQAMRICDAVGAYGIAYVPDPDSPFSKALGKAETVDTVRFPRITLYNRTGDCDDTTALLCSLLESAGIHTAILTTPGHIFLAFETGEPAENAAYISGGALETLTRDGSVWIPVETTVLSQGFMASWASASDLVKQYGKTSQFEFIPVAGMRDAYPALPLPQSPLTVAEPARASVDRAYSASLKGFTDSLYAARLIDMQSTLAKLSGSAAVKVRVRQGVLHALFGNLPEAEASFRKAIADDPTMVSPYVNLANVRLLSRDQDGALLAVKQGLAQNAGSALLNLLAARIYSDKGDAANTGTYFAKAEKLSPELAARWAALVPGLAARGGSTEGGAQRAAQADATPMLLWGADQ